MLKEIKTKSEHYFVDDQGRKQGEFKYWYENGQLRIHKFYRDGKLYGESKSWYDNGQLETHRFFKDGKDITKQWLKKKAIIKAWKSL